VRESAPWPFAKLNLGDFPAGGFASPIFFHPNPLQRVVDLLECFGRIDRQGADEFPIVELVRQILRVKAGRLHGGRRLPEAVADASLEVIAKREQGAVMPRPFSRAFTWLWAVGRG
jgi:hypothetical protein